ncbi:CHAT domain-containing protein [Promicromonospora sp. MS192]|uniref:CHAT domain-containing protein n=1 Tax=Promicromonospora sp. MS192 TaxID=3412684 RepID=UPI003C2AEE3A
MNGTLRCVRVDATSVTAVDIGPADEVIEHVRRLTADFAMAANDLIPAPLRAAATASLERNLKTLDAILLAPLRADGDLYVVAREPLLSVPWAALPSRSGLRTSVNSYVARGRTHARPTGERKLLAAAGPGVRHGADEARAVGEQWPGATVLTGKDAVTEQVRKALATHDVVHLATHGQHDADNPLFASIDLTDGPLFAHELDGTPLPGSVVILSSCEVGGSTQVLGGELLGLTSVLLRLGARAVIASVAKLSDELAARVMPRLHAHLRETDDPEAALAAALTDVAQPVPLVCFSSVEGLTAG